MIRHSRKKRGFTIIEVSFFVALSGLLAVGVIVGTANQIAEQRYADATNNFVEFLNTIYGKVNNVEGSSGGGRSSNVILGKIAVFGDRNVATGVINADAGEVVYTYTLVGSDEPTKSADYCASLTGLMNELCLRDVKILGSSEEWYETTQGVVIQSTEKDQIFTGLLLVAKSPSTGAISTYFEGGSSYTGSFRTSLARSSDNTFSLTDDLRWLQHFQAQDVDYCLYYDGSLFGGRRRDIRILKDARNETGVIEINLDQSEDGSGNRCE